MTTTYEPLPLIQRIRVAQSVLGTDDDARDTIHYEATKTKSVSEEDFFLAWHAALVMGPKF